MSEQIKNEKLKKYLPWGLMLVTTVGIGLFALHSAQQGNKELPEEVLPPVVEKDPYQYNSLIVLGAEEFEAGKGFYENLVFSAPYDQMDFKTFELIAEDEATVVGNVFLSENKMSRIEIHHIQTGAFTDEAVTDLAPEAQGAALKTYLNSIILPFYDIDPMAEGALENMPFHDLMQMSYSFNPNWVEARAKIRMHAYEGVPETIFEIVLQGTSQWGCMAIAIIDPNISEEESSQVEYILQGIHVNRSIETAIPQENFTDVTEEEPSP